jgi:hypothetical protein
LKVPVHNEAPTAKITPVFTKGMVIDCYPDLYERRQEKCIAWPGKTSKRGAGSLKQRAHIVWTISAFSYIAERIDNEGCGGLAVPPLSVSPTNPHLLGFPPWLA